MLRKIISIIVVLVAMAITACVDFINANLGGVNYRYLPFPVKVTSCGSSYNVYSNCTYPYIWWGIWASIIFWVIIFGIAYVIGKKSKK